MNRRIVSPARRAVLRVTELEDRTTPTVLGFNVFGSPTGRPPVVTVTRSDGSVLTQFFAYDPGFGGGVSAALGEMDGNASTIEVVTGAGPGGAPHAKVFQINKTSGQVLTLASFFAFDPTFLGGLSVAAGDVTGDFRADIVIGAGPGGGPHVRSFVVNPLGGVAPVPGPLGSFFAFDPSFRGGVNVVAGDLTGDGFAEVITAAGPGGGPHVIAYSPFGGQVASFFAFPAAFTGGVWLAPVVSTGQVLIGAGSTGAFGVSQLTVIGASTFLNPLTPFSFTPIGVDLLGFGNSSGDLVTPLPFGLIPSNPSQTVTGTVIVPGNV